MKKVAVFGDIHGNSSLLLKFILKVRQDYGNDIEIWSCGDLVDRGPDSKGVIDLCILYDIKTTRGNHDSWILELIISKYFSPDIINSLSGFKTIESYSVDWRSIIKGKDFEDGWSSVAVEFLNKMPKEHIAYLLNMYDVGFIDYFDKKYWILHAGLTERDARRFNRNDGDLQMLSRFSNEEPEEIVWARPTFRKEKDDLYHFDNATQIFGHSYTRYPVIKDHFIALDTIGGGQDPLWVLSGVILPDLKIIQVTD